MKMLNKNITILLLSFFCVLSATLNSEGKNYNTTNVSTNTTTVDVSFTRPSATGAQDASIVITIKGNTGNYKVIAVSDTKLGNITKEGKGSKVTLDRLYAGFYKLYIIDSNNQTTEYQVTID